MTSPDYCLNHSFAAASAVSTDVVVRGIAWFAPGHSRVSFSETITVYNIRCDYAYDTIDCLCHVRSRTKRYLCIPGSLTHLGKEEKMARSVDKERSQTVNSKALEKIPAYTRYDLYFNAYGFDAGHRWRLQKAISSWYAEASAALLQWDLLGGRHEVYYNCAWPVLEVGQYVLYLTPSRESIGYKPATAAAMFALHFKNDANLEKIKPNLDQYPNCSIRKC